MKIKKLLLMAATVSSVALLAACGSKSASAKDGNKTVKIGILQQINQTSLDEARKGFEAEMAKEGYKEGKNLKLDYVNAQGDQANLSTMSQRLAKDKNDINVGIATAAAQALQKADPKTPMVFTAITDPKSAGLVSSMSHPDKNATGVTDMVDVSGQIKLLHKIAPKAKTIGLLYNAAEPNSAMQIKLAKKAIAALGLKSTAQTVASTNDVEQATTALASQSQAIYIPADNTLAASMATVGRVSIKKGVPVVPAANAMVTAGGVATNGISYEKLGRQTAQMAIKILKGKKPSALPVEKPNKVSVFENKKMMKKLGIDQSVLK
ncbi:ABC transporter substrate-binding protein [Lacticaseibacillus zhaodongensis]|uniref:ABC transporter substrate-binding protein n=1 Tax=Lacticaseibacillus zhaodongensis TaxID=2668065 RepID=UPI0012D34056|nr:ABC transporter substrate-binding protein [Lacticaseibacillus zhaodongensis]